MNMLVAPLHEDRWFAVVDGRRLPEQTEAEFLDALPPAGLEMDVPIAERAIAAFGMEWAAISPDVAWAMLMLLITAGRDFSLEFMRWEPLELRSLRENHVAGGSASFYEAIRCLHRYRFAASLDIRPPIKAGD